jgi:hypothetical protein
VRALAGVCIVPQRGWRGNVQSAGPRHRWAGGACAAPAKTVFCNDPRPGAYAWQTHRGTAAWSGTAHRPTPMRHRRMGCITVHVRVRNSHVHAWVHVHGSTVTHVWDGAAHDTGSRCRAGAGGVVVHRIGHCLAHGVFDDLLELLHFDGDNAALEAPVPHSMHPVPRQSHLRQSINSAACRGSPHPRCQCVCVRVSVCRVGGAEG